MNLPEKFLKRMRERLGKDYPAFLASYKNPPYKALRVNELKTELSVFLKNPPFPIGEQVLFPEGEDITGFYIEEEKAGAYAEHFAGLYYLQEPSAMCVGELTAPLKKERVLDLCAAPGGKTVQLAVQMKGDGILISNEIDAGRAKVLSQNVERMGIRNCAVTNATPFQLAERFPAYFDLILVDAPCSGEGMFKKELRRGYGCGRRSSRVFHLHLFRGRGRAAGARILGAPLRLRFGRGAQAIPARI